MCGYCCRVPNEQLRSWAEDFLGRLIAEAETIMSQLATTCPFPDQRSILRQYNKEIHRAVAKAVAAVTEFDRNWTSNVEVHNLWKSNFMDDCYRRIHQNVARLHAAASLGFVDPSLYLLVRDPAAVAAHDFRKRVMIASLVEEMKTVQDLSFGAIAASINGLSSEVVGLQLCMGARYILGATGRDDDERWGFSMIDLKE